MALSQHNAGDMLKLRRFAGSLRQIMHRNEDLNVCPDLVEMIML